MFYCKVLIAITLCCQVGFPRTIRICGTVTDTSGLHPLSNAVVLLEKNNLTTKTDSNGNFHLASLNVEPSFNSGIFYQGIRFGSASGFITVALDKITPLEIFVVNISGREIAKIRRTFEPGHHILNDLNLGNGLYVLNVKNGMLIFSISFFKLQGITIRSMVYTGMKYRTGDQYATITPDTSFSDVIQVRKDGYIDY